MIPGMERIIYYVSNLTGIDGLIRDLKIPHHLKLLQSILEKKNTKTISFNIDKPLFQKN
jgi:hypothetical protein